MCMFRLMFRGRIMCMFRLMFRGRSGDGLGSDNVYFKDNVLRVGSVRGGGWVG